MITKIGQGIRNIKYWFPVIWNDYHWDYSSFLDIMKHKLAAIKADTANWKCLGADRIAGDIEQAITLIDAIRNDKHEERAFEVHEQRWGVPEFVFDKFHVLSVIYPNDQSGFGAEAHLSELLSDAESRRQEAVNELFGIIKDNFDSWWD